MILALRYIYLPSSHRAKRHTLASASTKEKERGDFSNKADFLQICSFCFEITARSLVVTRQQTGPGTPAAAHGVGELLQSADNRLSMLDLYFCTFSTSTGSWRILVRPSRRRAAL